GLPQVHIENFQRLLRHRAQKAPDRGVTRPGTLRQRTETDSSGLLRQLLPFWCPAEKIPGHRALNLIFRLPFAANAHVYRACRMVPVDLHVVDIEAHFLHAAQGFDTARVFPHAAGYNSMISHELRDVGEVRRSAAKTRSLG